MKKLKLLATTACMLIAATPAMAQTASTSAQDNAPTSGASRELPARPADIGRAGDMIVTTQRVSQRLQDVPIAISAFTAQNLEKQQIVNPLALQQSLPNITFTKTNFTTSSFTIRIGDLCTGATCDIATGIAVNDMPLVSTISTSSCSSAGSSRAPRSTTMGMRISTVWRRRRSSARSRAFVVNMPASYLHTNVSSDKFLVNPRDVSAGWSDAVIIKDITNGSNCVVILRSRIRAEPDQHNAITGQYVTDQSSGLFTNVFTLEPRRYGVAVGFKFRSRAARTAYDQRRP